MTDLLSAAETSVMTHEPSSQLASLFPPEPAPAAPAPDVSAVRGDARPGQAIAVAAALVLALAASLGVAVLWAANRDLAAEVDAAIARADAAQAQAADVDRALEAAPDAEAVDALADRIDGVEAWTGFPADGFTGSADLQTRLTEVSNGIDSLETDLRNGLGTVQNDLAAVRGEVSDSQGSVSSGDVDALRREIGELRGAVDGMRHDIAVLCWALGYRTDVNASC